MPIAVISEARRGAPRSGRYATRSIVAPSTAHAAIESTSTKNSPASDGSAAKPNAWAV